MKAQDQRELEELALAGELAGQLAHDVGSFLNHLFLQMDLAESVPGRAPDWQLLKREGKELAQLVQEWRRWRGSPPEPREIDLHQVIKEIVRSFRGHKPRVRIRTALARTPMLLTTLAREVRCLCRLLLAHAVSAAAPADARRGVLSVETRRAEEKIVLQIRGVAASDWEPLSDDDCRESRSPPSLALETCRGLALRVDATLRAVREADGKDSVVLEFPKELPA